MSVITTINATDKPRLSREVINTNFANLNAGKAEITDVVLLAGSYANPTWITSLSWAKITGAPSTYAPSAHVHPTADITSGTFADARIAASNVTQHQGALALAATQITSGTLALARGGTGANLSATGGANQVLKQTTVGGPITVAALVAADIPSLDTSKITTGTFADARIAQTAVTQHQAALTLGQSQVTNLVTDLAAKVAGASTLTTAGAVPFVTSSGTLGQDGSNLFWDNTNKRLGIGTASPAVPLDVVGNFRASGASSIFTGGALTISGTANAVHTIYISDYSAAAADWNYIRADNGKFTITGSLNNAIWLVPGGAGRVIISGNAGIGPSNTAPTGTLSVVDRTGVTGATAAYFGTDGTNTSATTTSVVIRAGQAQSTTKLLDVQNNAGTSIASIAADGGLTSPSLTYAGTLALSATGANVITLSTNGSERARFASDGTFKITNAAGKFLALTSTRPNSTNRNWDIALDNSDEGSLDIRKSSAKDLFDYSPVVSFARDGNVMIGTTTNSGARLNVQAGDLNPADLTGQITYTSTANKVLGLGASANDAFIQSFNGPLVLNSVARNVLVGTTTDDGSSKLQVAGQIAISNNNGVILQNVGGGAAASLYRDPSDDLVLRNATSNKAIYFRAGGDYNMASLSSAGTFTVYNTTATTGSTSLVVRAGAAQSGALQTWQNNAGSTLGTFDGAGSLTAVNLLAKTTTQHATIYSDSGTGTNYYLSGLLLQHGSVNRWQIYKSNDAAGNFTISRYNDAGVWQGSPIQITRADGYVYIAESGARIGFFGATPVAKQAALTAANNGTLNTGDATSDTIIGNMRTRIAELESKLQAYGLLN